MPPEGPGQNQVVVTKEMYDTLLKEVAELKRTIHGKIELPVSEFTNAPLSSVDTIVACRATEAIEQYQVVTLIHQSTQRVLPSVSVYDRPNTVGKLYTLGIALEAAVSGEAVRIQVDGTQYVRIEEISGTYGSASDRMYRTGCELKPNTGGTAVVLDHDDMESPSFIAMEDNMPSDSVLLVRILDQRDEYRGPFKGDFTDNAQEITIGIDRGNNAGANSYKYEFDDRLTWITSQGTPISETSQFSSNETVSVSADNTYVYYKVERAESSLTVTLEASTTHPMSIDWPTYTQYVLLGKARYDTTDAVVTAWIQYHYGQIYLREKNQPSFWAELTNRTSPYSWKRLQEDAATPVSPSVTGSEAYEVHALDGIPEGTRVRMWEAGDGAGTYRFECGFGGPGQRDFIGKTTEEESGDGEIWERDNQDPGKFGVVSTELVRIAWVPGSDAILYAFYRNFEYDSNGNLMSISSESRETIISINDICDECGPSSTGLPTFPPTGAPTGPSFDPCSGQSGCSVLSGSAVT
jgi:hypothetical protein